MVKRLAQSSVYRWWRQLWLSRVSPIGHGSLPCASHQLLFINTTKASPEQYNALKDNIDQIVMAVSGCKACIWSNILRHGIFVICSQVPRWIMFKDYFVLQSNHFFSKLLGFPASLGRWLACFRFGFRSGDKKVVGAWAHLTWRLCCYLSSSLKPSNALWCR